MNVQTDRSTDLRQKQSSEATRYHFVDTVRFFSMFAVVFMHCAALVSDKSPILGWFAIVPLKFGTIGFFVISGFLLGGRLDKVSPKDYLSKRIRRIFLPWLFWFLVYVSFELFTAPMHRHQTVTFGHIGLRSVADELVHGMLFSPYWFVPNLLLAMTVLLAFRRFLNDIRFGAALLAITLFYSVNIYGRWIPSSHNEALFGFVFFLWLGSYSALHFERIVKWIARIPVWTLVSAIAGSLVLCLAEVQLLHRLGVVDPLNTIRVSNIVYSLLAVVLLVKLPRIDWPRFIDVPNQTFAIYLIHPICISIATDITLSVLKRVPVPASSAWVILPVWLAVAAGVYSTCLLASDSIAGASAMRWSIGLSGPAQASFSCRRSSDFIPVPHLDSSRTATESIDMGIDSLWAARLAGG